MLPAGSTATCERHRKDDDMTELTRNDLDRHDWAARASQALAQAEKLPSGSKRSEAIRKAEQLRFAAMTFGRLNVRGARDFSSMSSRAT
jgi:hypothetical protein